MYDVQCNLVLSLHLLMQTGVDVIITTGNGKIKDSIDFQKFIEYKNIEIMKRLCFLHETQILIQYIQRNIPIYEEGASIARLCYRPVVGLMIYERCAYHRYEGEWLIRHYSMFDKWAWRICI